MMSWRSQRQPLVFMSMKWYFPNFVGTLHHAKKPVETFNGLFESVKKLLLLFALFGFFIFFFGAIDFFVVHLAAAMAASKSSS
jgi:hypothetical protein